MGAKIKVLKGRINMELIINYHILRIPKEEMVRLARFIEDMACDRREYVEDVFEVQE